MKKVNFERLRMRSLSGLVEEVDAREYLGEVIYARLGGLRNKLLAEKIFKSEGDCELTEEEAETLRGVLAKDLFSAKLTDALLEAIND